MLFVAGIFAHNLVHWLGLPNPPPPPAAHEAAPPAKRPTTAPANTVTRTRAHALHILITQSFPLGIASLFVIALAYVRALPSRAGIRALGLSFTDGRLLTNLRTGVIASVLVVPSVFAIIQLITVIATMIGHPPPLIAHRLLHDLRGSDSTLTRAIILSSAIACAPIFEEITFRGMVHTVMRNTLGERRRWLVVFLTATVFTLVHIGPGFWRPALLAIFTLGVAFSWLYERTGSLLPSMLVHVAFNAANCAIVLMIDPAK